MSWVRTNYLKSICGSSFVCAKTLATFSTGLKDYTTGNPVHANEVSAAVDQLREHLRAHPPRPMNCVILGGPGSGKTFLAEQLREATGAHPFDFNLSQYYRPEQIQGCFVEVAEWLDEHPDGKALAFFDEFDVRIDGMAATQYLIQPMYDGKVIVRGKKLPLNRAAFIFSGSYLKERRVYDSIKSGEHLDLARFLFDLHRAAFREPKSRYRDQLWQELMAVTSYDPVRQRMTADRDVIAYVRSLEKIVDFVSRINGFVIELRNLNTPLHATRDHYRIELESTSPWIPGTTAVPSPEIAAQLVTLIDGLRESPFRDWFYAYPDPQQPVLEYKNLLLTDRLARVIDMLNRTYKAKKDLRLSRDLLNYLVVVPLVHGMRSLATLIESLKEDDGTFHLADDTNVLERNIGHFHEFPSPQAVWRRVRKYNPAFVANGDLQHDGGDILTVH